MNKVKTKYQCEKCLNWFSARGGNYQKHIKACDGNFKKAKYKFWNELNKKVIKDYNIPKTAAIEKYNQLCRDIVLIKDFKINKVFSKYLLTVELKNLSENIDTLKGKWGYFYEYRLKNIKVIENKISRKFQTLTYFGLQKNFIKNFIKENNIEGIDRVVPVGSALNIGLDWDGYEIISALTRKIVVQ